MKLNEYKMSYHIIFDEDYHLRGAIEKKFPESLDGTRREREWVVKVGIVERSRARCHDILIASSTVFKTTCIPIMTGSKATKIVVGQIGQVNWF